MSEISARLMVPVKITSAMLGASTSIAEPDPRSAAPEWVSLGTYSAGALASNGAGAGVVYEAIQAHTGRSTSPAMDTSYWRVSALQNEAAWVSGGTYTLGQRRTRRGRVYECVQAHSGRTIEPELDDAYWLDAGPTNRMAAFDDYISTASRSWGSMTYVINPGFCNGITLYELAGDAYSVTIKDAPGGAVLVTYTGSLYVEAPGFYELLFTVLPTRARLSFEVPVTPTPEITITLTAASNNPVSIGLIKIGDWRQFMGAGAFGGAQYGASSERKSYTYREYFADGTYKTVIRPAALDVRCTAVIEAAEADYADSILAEVIDTPVPFEATGVPGYSYLSTVGFVSGSITADNFGQASVSLTIKGNV